MLPKCCNTAAGVLEQRNRQSDFEKGNVRTMLPGHLNVETSLMLRTGSTHVILRLCRLLSPHRRISKPWWDVSSLGTAVLCLRQTAEAERLMASRPSYLGLSCSQAFQHWDRFHGIVDDGEELQTLTRLVVHGAQSVFTTVP